MINDYYVHSEEELMGIEVETIDGRSLYVLRSDQGDGGWSLHTPAQWHEARKNDDAPAVLLSGPATLKYDEWDRPNEDDLRKAVKIALGK